MAIAVLDFRNYPGTPYYNEEKQEELSEYFEITVSQNDFDRE